MDRLKNTCDDWIYGSLRHDMVRVRRELGDSVVPRTWSYTDAEIRLAIWLEAARRGLLDG